MGGAVLALVVFTALMAWAGTALNPGFYNPMAAGLFILLLWGLVAFCTWALEAFNSWMDDWAFNRRR